MPALIEHIDAIARPKGRAALYLEFHPQSMENAEHDEPGYWQRRAEEF